MDRVVAVRIKGLDRVLNYSVEVMFDVIDKYENIQNALKLLEQNNKESFEVLRWLAVKMANDGELCRREAGLDKNPIVKDADISLRMKPLEYEELKVAVIEAITQGYRREVVDPNEYYDAEFLEYEAKKAKAGA